MLRFPVLKPLTKPFHGVLTRLKKLRVRADFARPPAAGAVGLSTPVVAAHFVLDHQCGFFHDKAFLYSRRPFTEINLVPNRLNFCRHGLISVEIQEGRKAGFCKALAIVFLEFEVDWSRRVESWPVLAPLVAPVRRECSLRE